MELTGGAILIKPVPAISSFRGLRIQNFSSLHKQVNVHNSGVHISFCQNIPKQPNFGRDSVPRLSKSDIQKQRVSSQRGSGSSIENDVEFPSDYPQLLQQAQLATKKALQDSKHLLEIEFPTAGLDSVSEMLVVEELYKDAVVNSERKMIIFNGELDRMRGGYYPSFFFPKIANLSKAFLPKIETVYYIHNFKGRQGGTLFRSYPGPWKVLRKVNGTHICLHQQETMPSLKDVAVNILPYN